MGTLNFASLVNGERKLSDEKVSFQDPKLLVVKPENGKDNEYEMYLRLIPNLGGTSDIIEKNLVHVANGKNGDSITFDMPQTQGYMSIFKTLNKILRDMKYNHINEDLVKKINDEYLSCYGYFYTYAYVEQDPYRPENNGKIMILRFPYKIKKMIQEAVEGTNLKAACDVYNLVTGKRFYFKVKKQGGFPNYDDCKFEDQCPFVYNYKGELYKASEEEIQAIIEGQSTPLSNFLNENLEGLEKYQYQEPTKEQLVTAANLLKQGLCKYQFLFQKMIEESNDEFMKSLLVQQDEPQQVVEANPVQSASFATQQPNVQAGTQGSLFGQPKAYAPQPAAQVQAPQQAAPEQTNEVDARYKQMLGDIDSI